MHCGKNYEAVSSIDKKIIPSTCNACDKKGGKMAAHMSEMHGVNDNICLDLFSGFVFHN